MRRRRQGANAGHRLLGCLLLAVSMLWALPGCRGGSAVEFPPTEETVQAAAERLGWTLDRSETKSVGEDRVTYNIETGDQTWVSVACTAAEGKRILGQGYFAVSLSEKPQFAWEDWEKAVTLAQTLYGGFDEGELYQALSEQDMPELQIPQAGPDTPTGRESLEWEVESPAGYARVRWIISAGEVEHGFPEPTVKNWRETFVIDLYESKDVYQSIVSNG